MGDVEISKSLLQGAHAQILNKALNTRFCEFKPGRLIMPENFQELAKEILDADVREDDIWVISYPKTGSTWLTEMVWLIANDLDFDRSIKTIQKLRVPMIEWGMYYTDYEEFVQKYGNWVDVCNNSPSPRWFKTHLTYKYLPRQVHQVKPKIVYVARHPKDVCVSYYHHCKVYSKDVTFADFAEMFLAGDVPVGNVFDHYLPYWQRRDEMNMLFLHYEDILRDPVAAVKQLAEFMGKPLSDEDAARLSAFLTVDNMRRNVGCYFETHTGSALVRKGIAGDWKNYMDDELSRRFDHFIEEHLRGTGLRFDKDS